MAITFEDALEYLESQRIELPDMMLRAIVGRVNSITDCMDEQGYDEYTQTMILAYLVGLLGLMSSDGKIRSQSAPSGASQSFQFGTVSERYNGFVNQIRALDPHGCADALIPTDPSKPVHCALFVSPGVCQ